LTVSSLLARAERNLADAAGLSRLYEAMGILCRRVGNATLAQELQTRRIAVWQEWDRALPGNAFVQAELAATR
jgi:hypothetical protein